VWLDVPANQPPSPFLPAGKFTAVWNGFITVDLRGDYAFRAELNGGLKLEIRGETIWEGAGTGEKTSATKSVQLNKGPNPIQATFTSPAMGDAMIRLYWQAEKAPFDPIPSTALTHGAAPEIQKAQQLRFGRELFLDYRCAKCHARPTSEAAVPELNMDAPSLDGIGARLNYDWMARWIVDPKALRPQAHMPRLLNTPTARDDAQAIAAFLASLTTEGEPVTPHLKPEVRAAAALKAADSPDTASSENKPLFEKLHCTACHNASHSTAPDASKIPLNHVAEKFAPGRLAEFLRQPEAHYAWIRMPDFRLAESEARELADFLLAAADKPGTVKAPADKPLIERGQNLVRVSGCLNCHSLKLNNSFATKKLADLKEGNSQHGCLAASPAKDSPAPQFTFTAGERAALQALLATDRA